MSSGDELLVIPPHGPVTWLWPELAGLEDAAPRGAEVLDLREHWHSPDELLAAANGRRLLIPAGPRGATLAALLRSAARFASTAPPQLRIVGSEVFESLEQRLLAHAEPAPRRHLPTLHRLVRSEPPSEVWFFATGPLFATGTGAHPGHAHTRLAPACWGLLPGDHWPRAARDSWLQLLAESAPARRLTFLELENSALAGLDLFAESLARPTPLPTTTRRAGPLVLGIDGIDGAGKSSHLRALQEWLTDHHGLSVARLKMYRHGVFHDTVTDMTRRCADDHHLHLWPLQRHAKLLDSLKYHREVVDQAAADHDVLLFDRYVQTHLAAGAGRFHHDPYAREFLAGLPRAHAVVLLDVPVEVAVARLAERPELTVDENPYMLSRFRSALLAEAQRDGWPVLDSRRPFATNRDQIRDRVTAALADHRSARTPGPALQPRPTAAAADFPLSPHWQIEVTERAIESPSLVPFDSSFAVALGSIPAAARRRIPDRVVLDLYGYEIVERLRDLQRQDPRPRRVQVPLCPNAVYAAADVTAHAGGELRGMWPPATELLRTPISADRAATISLALFGELRFDPERYAADRRV